MLGSFLGRRHGLWRRELRRVEVAGGRQGGRCGYDLPRWHRRSGREREGGSVAKAVGRHPYLARDLLALVARGVGEELDEEGLVGGGVELALYGRLARNGL